MFTSMPASQTGIDFTNQLDTNPDLNSLSYIYYYNGGGVAVSDINNDGLPDIYLTANSNGEHLNIYNEKIIRNGYQNQYSRNCLQLNNGSGETFSDVRLLSGMSATDWSWSPLFVDFDNDGNKDLFISSGIVKRLLDLDFINFFSNIKDPRLYGSPEELKKTLFDKMPDGAYHPFFLKGNESLHFSDSSEAWGTNEMKGYFNGAAYADFDNDGNEDVVINCLNAPAVILKNNAPKQNYLSLSFQGNIKSKGIGSKAYLFANGKMQYEQLMLTRGFMSSSEAKLRFGLGDIAKADSLLIVWPNQQCQVIKNVVANQSLLVKQSDANSVFHYKTFFPPKQNVATNVTSEADVNWKHNEDAFNDFNNQFLLPHIESTRGPKFAVGDVNKDGLDDVFIYGAKGQAGCLLIQTKDGHFIKAGSTVFAKNKDCKDVDAIFFNVNNDGFLYVVSGGNEYEDENSALSDHLYMNDGEGHFAEITDLLPSIFTNKSCVSVADINKDGSPDLFVGRMASSKNYGYDNDSSYLLLNDGKGHFYLIDNKTISLSQTGLVTSSSFADINSDGWPDLMVAGEWMPLTIFINHKGIFQRTEASYSSGLWQSLFVIHVNGDGHPDILAGNWGLNSKLHTNEKHPLKLFVKDYDNNGTTEPVMTYSVNGEDCPFLGKDQLEQMLPALKREHLRCDEVAGKDVQYVFGKLFSNLAPVERKAEVLASSCFMNDGKGNFARIKLPDELQLAPIFAFTTFPYGSSSAYLVAGNFYCMQPYEGRYDALQPTLFSYQLSSKNFHFVSSILSADGEVRDAKWIHYAGNKRILVIAVNNGQLVFLAPE